MAAIISIAYIGKAKEEIVKGKDRDIILKEIAEEIKKTHNDIDEDTANLAAKLAYARAIINIYQSSNKEEHEESDISDREHERFTKSA